jgi:hypothetical protein
MIKEIKYNGYTANPSDYECPDGDLATAMGFIPEDGTMKPVLPPSVVLQLESGATVKFIHETANFSHYIILKTNGSLQWWNGKDTSSPTSLHTFTTTIYQVTAVGNTLVVLASDGMHYFLWIGDKSDYKYLGTHIPELSLSFGLQGNLANTGNFDIEFDPIHVHMEGSTITSIDGLTDENKSKITSQVLAKVNKFVAENTTNAGRFIFPFFVRYAYRLYDGSLAMHSAPIFMLTSSDLSPQCFVSSFSSQEGNDKVTKAALYLSAVFHRLDYAVVDSAQLDDLKNWEDIVSSIDIFISQPIYTYDQAGQCQGFLIHSDSSEDAWSVCKAKGSDYYQKRFYTDLHVSEAGFAPPSVCLQLPYHTPQEVKEDIRNISQFYLLRSYKIDALSSSRQIVEIEDDYLQSLVAREVMTDDYDSHDTLIPRYAFPYNQRLNLANLSKKLFDGYNAASVFTYTDGFKEPTTGILAQTTIRVYFFIKQDGNTFVVRGDVATFGANTPLLFLYYPNTNAYKAVVMSGMYTASYYEVPLEPHDFLNGAFYFKDWKSLDKLENKASAPTLSESTIIGISNKIYTSEVNNPFLFPLSGINAVGTGEILGISSATKALSQGQFGQFPLYAFTTEGVWALEVSSTGTYSAKQPVTRDVCINPESITQIDSAVLFVTDRGIMLISGSETQCISDALDAEDMFVLSDLPFYDKIIDFYNGRVGEDEQLNIQDLSFLSFKDFLADCRMIYDYVDQRIVVYNPNVHYAYLYSMKTYLWGMMRSDIVDNVNSYPEALAMAHGAKLVDFSKPVAENISGLIITRPFKLDAPDSFKTINTVIQRGMFRSAHVQQILYGSNDLIHWHTVWSSVDKIMRGFRGTPYKAYRLALVCHFNKAESIYGCTVVFEPRMTNQVR